MAIDGSPRYQANENTTIYKYNMIFLIYIYILSIADVTQMVVQFCVQPGTRISHGSFLSSQASDNLSPTEFVRSTNSLLKMNIGIVYISL